MSEFDEENDSKATTSEFAAIHLMLKRAKEFNLENEVVWSFWRNALDGCSVEESASYALDEWDL